MNLLLMKKNCSPGVRRAFSGIFGKARDRDDGGGCLHVDQVLAVLLAEDAHDSLSVVARRQPVDFLVVMCKAEFYLGMCQYYALELGDYVSEFGIVGFEEFAACRDVIKEVFDAEN